MLTLQAASKSSQLLDEVEWAFGKTWEHNAETNRTRWLTKNSSEFKSVVFVSHAHIGPAPSIDYLSKQHQIVFSLTASITSRISLYFKLICRKSWDIVRSEQ
jgi:hypothetical protein